MGFETLLGNDQLKSNLEESLKKGRVSHFYLISGPKGSGKHTLAKLLAAAILCQSPNKPCGVCHVCRKVLENSHPDFITVDDPEKKTVAVDLIRQTIADIYIQPNEADHKIYLFPRAQDMGIPSQNALLKVLEEPPKYGVFLLLTDNPERLLPTVRSRCTLLQMRALPEDLLRKQLRYDFPEASSEDIDAAIFRSGGFHGQARALLTDGSADVSDFAQAFGSKSDLALVQVLAPMEKWKRDALIETLQSWLELLENALLSRSGITAVSSQAKALSHARRASDIYQAIGAIQKALEYAKSNVSPAAVCGYLSWALR